MRGDTLTVVSAVAGIIVGFLTSWWFTLSSKREAEAKQVTLLQQVSALRSLLSSVAKSITKPVITQVDVEQALQSTRLADNVADAVAASLKSAAPASTVDVLVWASLGALVNEHGDVSVPRLLREVARALPDASPSSVLSSLEDLRKAGKVSWSGDDVKKASVVVVHSQSQQLPTIIPVGVNDPMK